MGKDFVKNRGSSGGSRVKKNISKRDSDKKRRVTDFHKAKERNAKVQAKQQEWEMRK